MPTINPLPVRPGSVSRGAQRLMSGFDPVTGHFRGTLACSIFLTLSSQAALVIEEVLGGVVMGDVLNPFGRAMLADEMQRMMRIGLGQWLVGELSPALVSEVVRSEVDPQTARVHFAAPMMDGSVATLVVDVPATSSNANATTAALEAIRHWSQQQNRRPLHADLIEVLRNVDTSRAAYLSSGIALSTQVCGN